MHRLHAPGYGLACALCTSCIRMHSDCASLACSRLRPCNVLYAPLASACIATLRRVHALGYGLAMRFVHLLLPHALRLCVACMLQATALLCALCTTCLRMHSDFASLACSRLRPCNVLCAPLASACIATLRRLHAPGYGLAMCFMAYSMLQHLFLLVCTTTFHWRQQNIECTTGTLFHRKIWHYCRKQ